MKEVGSLQFFGMAGLVSLLITPHITHWERTKQYSAFIYYCKITVVLILDGNLRILQPHHAVKRIGMYAF